MSNNVLERLPESLGELKLIEMMACGNMLRSLPNTFDKLTSLRKLKLDNNAFESFPSSIRKLKQLEELQIAGNNFIMVDSAQLALELPKLRVFSAPET